MTVRWKPLLFLSGVFLVVGLIGVVAIVRTLVPRSAQDTLRWARTAREAGRFEDSEIYFKQAIQKDADNAAIHEDFAGLYRDWARRAPAEKRSALRSERISQLRQAVKYDKAIKGPRLELLQEAMREDDVPSSNYWAAEVLNVDSQNFDAHYTLAVAALEIRPPNLPEARRHLEVLTKKNGSPIRLLLVRAMLAEASGDVAGRGAALAQARTTTLKPDAEPVDCLAGLRITAMTIRFETDPGRLDERVGAMLQQVKEMGSGGELAPSRVARLRFLLERTQKSLMEKSATATASTKKGLERLVDAIETEVESVFKAALSASDEPDLHTYLAYADHLKLRRQRDRCLEVVDQALKSPLASRLSGAQIVMTLHIIAVEMALSTEDDKGRFEKADPHIRALLDRPEPKAQAFGHLFAGSIDLDRSNNAREAGAGDRGAPPGDVATRLRSSAVKHLKIAATSLPDVSEAQARYGVALVLAGEQNLGRQFLQTALRLGNLDPQFQLWAAWAILQAGYPEEAEPIVVALLRDVAAGNASHELEGGLYLLSGEIHQSRRTPDDLNKAIAFFEKALATGKETGTNVVFRLAQIDVQTGHYDRALSRINALKAQGKESAAAEQLAVLTLEQQGKGEEARSRLQTARAKFPDGADLAGIEAAMLNKHGKPDLADRVLADFLVRQPDNATLVMMRAQIQAESLKNFDQARSLLLAIGEKSENSAPLVQLAGFELERNQLDAAGEVIAKIRSRWKEAATSDVLEAQLALKRGHPEDAVEHLDDALRKDPGNKIVQYWKAQLDGQTGEIEEATRSLEAIVKNKPIKEVDPGTTLMSAAQSALAGLSLRTGALDDAIRRFEELKRSNANGTLSKLDRWQLITAYVARGQWPSAKREIASLLNDPKNPPSDDERVRGANFYRQQGDDASALAQLDYVLKVNPSNPPAVVTRSYILLKAKQYEQAGAILRTAIELLKQKDKPRPAVFYLLLAAVENDGPPAATSFDRASAALNDGLASIPGALELVQAKYYAMKAVGKTQAAIEFVEAEARAFPKGDLPRELVKVYREERLYEKADRLLRDLLKTSPDDTNLAAALIEIISIEATEAGTKQQPGRQRELSDQATSMIRQYRARFKNSTIFIQAECRMAARAGDYPRAIELTHEMDKLSKTSPMGALLRARIYATQGKTRDLAQAYKDALDRAPRQLELRVLLGQTKLKLGDTDDALRQANMVLDVEKNRLDARLLQARALGESGRSPTEKDQRQRQAISQLEEVTKVNPRMEDAFHTLAEIQFKRGNQAAAVAVLKEDLKANPTDASAASRLIEILSTPRPAGDATAGPGDLAEAKRLAAEITEQDKQGSMKLAVAIGYHKAHQFELAMPYAEAAAVKLGTPAAHLNFGDILLTLAESHANPERKRSSFERAVAQYDLVLKAQPNSIEAINNKAWILHTYLDQSRQALELVLALQKRVNSTALPGEFYDTLGSIQESIGQVQDAEQTYTDGLKKSPEHPVLNYHFGKMIAGDRSRAIKALPYLRRAIGKLNPPMNKEAVRLVQLIDRKGGDVQ